MELLSFDNLRQTLEEYGQEVRNLYQDKLITHDHFATGELLNSMEFIVEGDGQRWEVSLDLASYWKFVERGVNGTEQSQGSPYKFHSGTKRVNVPAILEWIKWKPVLPRPDDKGKLPTPEGLAIAIATNIAKRGLKGTHDLEESIEEINEKYRDKIALAIAKDGETFYKLFDIRGQLAEK